MGQCVFSSLSTVRVYNVVIVLQEEALCLIGPHRFICTTQMRQVFSLLSMFACVFGVVGLTDRSAPQKTRKNEISLSP